jgi:hypothetical protein
LLFVLARTIHREAAEVSQGQVVEPQWRSPGRVD